MSDKSYHTTDNTYVSNVQGGEKKVMKKILTVALSTAMAFSMFASVAFGDTATTPQAKFDALKAKGILTGYQDGSAGLDRELTRAEFAKIIVKTLGLKEVTGVYTFKDKNYNAKNWAAPYIEAVNAAGIMTGKDNVKKIFDFNGKVTIEEMAKVLSIALKLDVPTNADNSASTWAKGYVQAAINAGYISANANFKANATRELAVNAAYAIDQASQKPAVSKYEVQNNGKTVVFTLADGQTVKVDLTTALPANVAQQVQFKYKGFDYTESVTYVVTDATAVQSVYANNLKEITVAFNGKVDQDTAEEVSNYTLRSGKVITGAALSADAKTVTLTLQGTLNNNKADALSVAGVKAGSATISANNVEFTTVDNTLPVVESVQSLGTKSVKVVFSEPVNGLAQSNFTLDGKAFYGKVDMGANNRSAILTPYTSGTLSVGAHQLTASQVKDYAGFVALAKTFDFTVVEDTAAPTITESSATLESVTVTFSEVVDPATISGSNVYWMSGTSKKTATAGTPVKLADNKYKFVFGAGSNSLPTGAVTIFVTGVKDYSGNTIASNTSFVVNPTIDQTRPEVTRISAPDARTVKVTFNKEVLPSSVSAAGNYTVTNKDGKAISVRGGAVDPSDSKSILISLYSDLSTGSNNVAVRNIKDTTKLQNTMLDFNGTVTVGDTTAPALDSKIVSATDRRVVIAFSEKMNVETLTNYANYYATVNNATVPLTPALATFDVLQDGKAVAITFAETFNNKDVVFASGASAVNANVSAVTVLGVKDLAGNLLSNFTSMTGNTVSLTTNTTVALAPYKTGSTAVAELVDNKTVKVKFSAPILEAQTGAFSYKIGGVEQVDYVDVDSSSVATVHFKNSLGTDAANLSLTVEYSKLVTAAGNLANTGNDTVTVAKLIDSVAPEAVLPASGVYTVTGGETIVVPFSEVLDTLSPYAATDFKVVRTSDLKELDPTTDYTVALGTGNKSVEITLKDSATRTATTDYKVTVKNAKYVADKAGNTIADSDAVSADVVGTAAPAVTGGVEEISGVDTTMEYKGSTGTWTAVTGDPITGLTAGTYQVRVKSKTDATTGVVTPAGAIATVTVTAS
ncbi:S-layer homology domain-containing protein [Paenibacillus sp. JX-17]|uniref:S-layer homology domain-containing protein n=1 Tax=Paenibacillus lacisoli TaxID=3064525 RepID=A0ABT9CBA5_9BACL|nr:S-layer homology domain-containing protein [Paenibacillus sp. JX-17]MDO7906545.1 S-layer homology domain-containing protein [Paenibacillus sp. JX-17]